MGDLMKPKHFLWAFILVLLLPARSFAAGAFVQIARNSTNAHFINISPTAGNLLVFFSSTSSGGSTPTLTSLQAMSATGGTGSVLASFTVNLATTIPNNYYVSGAYLANLPSGTASILATFNGQSPAEVYMEVSEYSGLAASSPLIVATRQFQSLPGTSANALTSGTASVTSIPAMIVGMAFDENGNAGDIAAGTSFTKRGTNTGQLSAEDRRETGATGSYAATFTAATNGAGDKYDTTMFAFSEPSGAACTHSGVTSAGALATPNGTSGSYWGKTGSFVTPDCSTVNYWQPLVGNFGVN